MSHLADNRTDRFIRIIGDVDAFKQVLEDAFRDWHGTYDVLMEQTGQYLFQAKKDNRFCPFCAKLRSTPEGERRCHEFDKSVLQRIKDRKHDAQFYMCHAGLTDTAIPIRIGDDLVATIFFGQTLIEDESGQAQFMSKVQDLDKKIGFNGQLEAVAEHVPVVTRKHIGEVRARVERLAAYVAKLGADRLQLQDKLHREHQHVRATEIVRRAGEQLNDVSVKWDDFWVSTSLLMEDMRQLVGAVCGMVLIPGRGENEGMHTVSALCGLPPEKFFRRSYKLSAEVMEKLQGAQGMIEYVNDHPGAIRQSIIDYSPKLGNRIDKLFLVKFDLKQLGDGVLVYFINNDDDVARGSLKIDNGDHIERTTLEHFAGTIALAFNNRRLNERSARVKNERREWLEKVSHQIVQSVGVVRNSAHGISKWTIDLGERNQQAFAYWSSKEIDFFFDRMDEVFYGSNNALRVAQNLKRSVFTPRDDNTMDWEWEIEADVPGLMIQIARDFQQMAKDHGLRRVHVETPPLSLMNERLKLIITEELFRQAVANLLENAVKYSYKGGEIFVTGRITNGMAVIDITNEGIQLPEAEVEKIFEYGYRSAKAIRLNAPGTGIGLKVARDIIDFHGGTITALPSVSSNRLLDNKQSWLTTFTIRLPLQPQR